MATSSKSTLTVSNGTLGVKHTLKVTRASTSYTHTIKYTCGTVSGTICTKSKSTTIYWTEELGNKLSLAKQNTTGTTVSVKFTITTYNGTTSLGSNSYTKTFAIPASVKPSCKIVTSDAKGYLDEYEGYVQGKSAVAVTVTPTLAYGSAIYSHKTTIEGITYKGPSITSNILKGSGTITVKTIVTDKRGRSSDPVTVDINVLPYAPPSITRLTLKRCDADGTEDIQGAYGKAIISGSISSLNDKNTANYTLEYGKTSDSIRVSDPLSIGYIPSDYEYIFAADTGSSYSVKLTATDNFTSVSYTTKLSTAFAILHWIASGLGFAVGKIAELENFFDVGFFTRFRKSVYVDNNQAIYYKKADGTDRNVVTLNASDNTHFGSGSYDNSDGEVYYSGNITILRAKSTANVQGSDLVFKSNTAGATYQPYYRAGNSVNMYIRTGGYITNSGTQICFTIPLAKPVVGSTNVSITSIDGLIIRQGSQYTHGSAASTYAKPSSYSAAINGDGNFIMITATMSNATNAVNNDACGIYASVKVTFS